MAINSVQDGDYSGGPGQRAVAVMTTNRYFLVDGSELTRADVSNCAVPATGRNPLAASANRLLRPDNEVQKASLSYGASSRCNCTDLVPDICQSE